MRSNQLHLTLIKPDGSREVLSFEQDSIILGSGPSAALSLPGASVSPVHAMLKVENGVVSVLDLGSESGLTVDGQKTAQATLTGGETIGIGEYRLVLGEEAPAATQPAETDVAPLSPRPFRADGSAVRLFSDYRADEDLPTADDRLLEVAMVWSDTVIGVKHLKPGVGRVVLGGTDRHDFVVGVDDLPSGEHVLVEPQGKEFLVRDLAGNTQVLPLKDQQIVVVGEVGFVVRWVRPSKRLASNPWANADFYFTKVMSTSMVAHVAFFVALLLTPIHHDALSEDLFGNPNRFAKLIIEPESNEPKKKFKDLSEVEEQVETEEPKFGQKVEVEEKTPEKKGAPVIDVDKREQDKKKVMKTGLLAALDSGGAGSSSNIFDGGGLGTGINNALGGLQNGNAGDAMGAGGIGSRGAGAGGGGGGLGIGGLGTKGGGGGGGGYGNLRLGNRGRAKVSVKPSDAQIVGNMDKEVIAKVVRRHQNEIKFCYEREIQKDPNLAGKVSVTWVIGPTGAVNAASVAQSSLGNSNVENCILSKVKRWKFPAPKGGGIVQVTYPWMFKPSA